VPPQLAAAGDAAVHHSTIIPAKAVTDFN